MSDAASPKEHDVALVCGPTDDRQGAKVLRARKGVLEAGEVRPIVEGQSLAGREVVRLTPRADAPALCDVEVMYPAEARRDQQGPAQVATDEYRANWERIFGKGERKSSPPDRVLN
jgi:hypothetical protein